MLLMLVRHAQAAEQDSERYPDDALRPLMPKGKRVQRRMSEDLCKRELIPSRVFSSPWKRAWQTARILIEATGLPKSARIACDALAKAPDLAALSAAIGAVAPDETIALVGHEPWMSELADMLLTGTAEKLRVDFPKSGVMGIQIEDLESGTGSLQFFLIP